MFMPVFIYMLIYSANQEADTQGRGYLDFPDFQRFVKALKARPEIDRLYEKLASEGGGTITYEVFERFMTTCQKVCLNVHRNAYRYSFMYSLHSFPASSGGCFFDTLLRPMTEDCLPLLRPPRRP